MKVSSGCQTGNLGPGRNFLSRLPHVGLLSDQQLSLPPFSSPQNSARMSFLAPKPQRTEMPKVCCSINLPAPECLWLGGNSLGLLFGFSHGGPLSHQTFTVEGCVNGTD